MKGLDEIPATSAEDPRACHIVIFPVSLFSTVKNKNIHTNLVKCLEINIILIWLLGPPRFMRWGWGFRELFSSVYF